MFRSVHHVQVAVPAGAEVTARHFYADLLGLTEIPKPAALAGLGGAWFRSGAIDLHLGVEPEFAPAGKAHPALLTHALSAVAERCEAAGHPVTWDDRLPGHRRCYVSDPFGNRLELLEPSGTPKPPAPGTTIRPAGAEDLPTILTIMRANPVTASREGDRAVDDPGYAAAFAEIQADPRQQLLVAERAGLVVSTCTLRLLRGLVQGGGLIAQVESMHTSPDVRGQGVGTAMMTWIIEEATRRGCVRVELTSDASRRDAHRFYQSLGFVGTHLGMKLSLG